MSRTWKGLGIAVLAAALIVGPWLLVRDATTLSGEPQEAARAEDRELVVTYLTADGEIARSTLVDSLTVYGDGPTRITDVGEQNGVRNLSGFRTPSFDGEAVTWEVEVDGQKELLTAADAKGPLPVSIEPRYFLDGTEVPARDLLGASGAVAVEYRLVNQTARSDGLTFFGPNGGTVTEPVTTFVPLVAQVSLELPSSSWANLEVPGGRLVTDDNGVHRVSFSPLLTPLVGAVDQTVRFAGDVTDFELGVVRVTALPLDPPGVDTARQTEQSAIALYDGLGELDTNVLRLRDGTVELIAGLTALEQGIGAARSGVGAVGQDQSIIDGLSQIAGGLEDLGSATAGLPAARAGVQDLIDGVRRLRQGLGTTARDGTVLGGLRDLGDGIDELDAGLDGLVAVLGGAPDDAAAPPSESTTLRNDAEFLKDRANDAVAACDGYAAALGGLGVPVDSCSALGLGPATIGAIAGAIDAKAAGARAGITGSVQPGLGLLSAGVDDLIAGVRQVKVGLRSRDARNPGVIEGLRAVSDGLTRAIAGIGTVGVSGTLADGTDRLIGGARDLGDGLDQLGSGAGAAVDGAGQIAGGQTRLSRDGTRVIRRGVAASGSTASRSLALLTAMSERARTDQFLYGPPAGEPGSAAYVYELGGIVARNAESVVKGILAALFVIALAILARAAMRRRGGLAPSPV